MTADSPEYFPNFPAELKTPNLILKRSSLELAESLLGYRAWKGRQLDSLEAAQSALYNDDIYADERLRYYVYPKGDNSGKARGYIELTFDKDPTDPVRVFCNTADRKSIRQNGIAREAALAVIGRATQLGYKTFSAPVPSENTAAMRLANTLGFKTDPRDKDLQTTYFFLHITQNCKVMKSLADLELPEN